MLVASADNKRGMGRLRPHEPGFATPHPVHGGCGEAARHELAARLAYPPGSPQVKGRKLKMKAKYTYETGSSDFSLKKHRNQALSTISS